MGRRLSKISAKDKNNAPMGTPIEYYYNADGIRTAKTGTINGNNKRVEYILNGDQIRYKKRYNGNKVLTDIFEYIYDSNGSVIYLKHRTNANNNAQFTDVSKYDLYYYVKNVQGDVVSLVQVMSNGTDIKPKEVAKYEYSDFGEITSVKALNSSGVLETNNANPDSSRNIAHLNPIRYRSYYYDTETGFYYLQSRYYDPSISRFINADG